MLSAVDIGPVVNPKHHMHKASGLGRVRLSGADHYTGKWGTNEAEIRYLQLLAEWRSNGCQPIVRKIEDNLNLNHLAAAFEQHARTYYPQRGRSHERRNFQDALRTMIALYGMTPVGSIGALQMRSARDAMVQTGLARTTINARMRRIRQVFKWGVSEGLVPAAVLPAIGSVAPLRAGRTIAPEPEPVGPVPDQHIEAVLPHVSPAVATMIQVQLLTGMRPGELVTMKSSEIDTTAELWEYRPERHKTQHHGHRRVIVIGPKARALVEPMMGLTMGRPLFVNSKGKAFTPLLYAQAVRRACRKACIPHWSPNQLRHNAATEIRRAFGVEAAQAILGHSRIETTQIYAERSQGLARDVARKLG